MSEQFPPNTPGMNPPEGLQVGMPGENGFYIHERTSFQDLPRTERGFAPLPRDIIDADKLNFMQGEDMAYAAGVNLTSAELAVNEAEAESGVTDATNEARITIAGARDVLNNTDLSDPNLGLYGAISRDYDTYIAEGGDANDYKAKALELAGKLANEAQQEYEAEVTAAKETVPGSGVDLASKLIPQVNYANHVMAGKYKQKARQNSAEQPSVEAVPMVESGPPQTHQEKLVAYTEEEIKRMMSDPNEVSSLIAAGRSDFGKRFLKPMREKYASEPTDENGKKLAALEKEMTRFTRLTEFRSQWEGEQRSGGKQDFSEFMQSQAEADNANENPTPEQYEHFVKFRDANSLAFGGNKSYGLNTVAHRYAREVAVIRLGE